MWPFRRFSFMVRLWLRTVYRDFGFRWRRVRRPARLRAGRRPLLGVECLETIEAANDLTGLGTALAAGSVLVIAAPNPTDSYSVRIIADDQGDNVAASNTTNTSVAAPTDAEVAAANQYFVAVNNDPSLQPTGPVAITLPTIWQPGDGLTSDATTPSTGGNGAFARPLSGTNAQGQAAQGSSGLTNTPHMPTVNANASSGAPAPLAAAPSGPVGLIGGSGTSAATASPTTPTTGSSTTGTSTTATTAPLGHDGGGSHSGGGIVPLDSPPAGPTVQFTQTAYTTPEGENTNLTVSLSASSAQTVTVQYATANGTAQAGVDYASAGGTLTFNPGTTSEFLTVPGLDDGGSGESGENFTVTLSNPTNATLGSANTATVNITEDNDGGSQPTVQFAQPTYTSAEGSPTQLTVTLSAASSQPVSVQYATQDGTARAGVDYTATSLAR